MTDRREGTGVPEEVLREAVRHAASATSVRRVARQAELAPRTLELFLKDPRRTPHVRTLRNLRNWYVRTAHTRGLPTSTDAAAAFDVLLEGLSAEQLAAATSDVLRILTLHFEEAGTQPPAWLTCNGTAAKRI